MQQAFNLTLPLSLGAEVAKNQVSFNQRPHRRESTAELQCSVTLPTSRLTGLHRNKAQPLKLPVLSQKIKNNIMYIKLGEPCESGEGLLIGNIGSEIGMQTDALFPFRISINTSTQHLQVRITKLTLQFVLLPLPKAKFVKNERLQCLDRNQDNEWGLLTMDQQQRIVVEDKCSQFPAIGIWITGKCLDALSLTKKLADYCTLKLDKKCRFISQNNRYFYLAKFSSENKSPELYLVQYGSPKETFVILEYPLDQACQRETITLRSDEHSHLEFTLRSDEKVPQKLQNIECSPILFKEDSTSIEIDREEPDSPRFRQNNYDSLEIECASLRRLVKLQQHEINELRSQLMRVTASMRHYQGRHPLPAAKTARPSRTKILTEKDLSLGSPSDPPSTSNSSSEVPEDWNAWDKFQIVDK